MERNAVPYETATVQLNFPDDQGLRDYLRILASLLHYQADCHLTIDRTGQTRRAVPFDDLQRLIDVDQLHFVDFRLRLDHLEERLILRPAQNYLQLQIRLLFGRQPTDLLWLQSSLDPPTPFPIIALPVHLMGQQCHPGLTLETLHPLIVLAVHTGGLTSASCVLADRQFSSRWSLSRLGNDSLPLRSSREERLWRVDSTVAQPALWFTPSPLLKTPEINDQWWEILLELRQRWPESRPALKAHLAPLLPSYPSGDHWELEAISPDHLAGSHAKAPVAIIQPEEHRVRVAIDPQLEGRRWGRVLLHSLAHLALGHIRPGDQTVHTDDLQSVINPLRHRDQLASQYTRKQWIRPGWCEPESLADCSPEQKARLGLWRILNERLGDIPFLHMRAQDYQNAAYQRQAAERLVSILDKYRGAMLCDGVGLGKTYVATTVIVHYVNQWLDRLRDLGEAQIPHKYRISVIVPNSVEKIWKSNALTTVYSSGVTPAMVRVITHSKLRQYTSGFVNPPAHQTESDLEHLIFSDLVIIDEAHAFRSEGAIQAKLLRSLLRLQPAFDGPRRVLLLTATPINNELDDLRRELSLLFSPVIKLGSANQPDQYQQEAREKVAEILSNVKARGTFKNIETAFDIELKKERAFRDDLDFGLNVACLSNYLDHESEKLNQILESIRTKIDQTQQCSLVDISLEKNRIAEQLLDRIAVQRSRAMCRQIENRYGDTSHFLFRSARAQVLQQKYAEKSKAFESILSKLLSLFNKSDNPKNEDKTLTLKVYLWQSCKTDKEFDYLSETGSVIGLQKTQLLKRLESSLISFLISLVRLTVTHANRLNELKALLSKVGESHSKRGDELNLELERIFDDIGKDKIGLILQLITGSQRHVDNKDVLDLMCNEQVDLFSAVSVDDQDDIEKNRLARKLEKKFKKGDRQTRYLDNLWELKTFVLSDFQKLLEVLPSLIISILGEGPLVSFPKRIVASGKRTIEWPSSGDWGRRLVTDEKMLVMVKQLLLARREGRKVVVFSQFSETVGYIKSVLSAVHRFDASDWQFVLQYSELESFDRQDIQALCKATGFITSKTDNRERVINRFAPYYRLGPTLPDLTDLTDTERNKLDKEWRSEWAAAITMPVDVLITTDVLAEGVNLQDAAVLINYDVHWNPVKMIQRAGRIDRRLNPAIEKNQSYPDLETLARELGRPVPEYSWHKFPDEPPLVITMILPDTLEKELKLREKVAMRTLLIDLAFGLEQGTGAEAAWLNGFTFNGAAEFNSTESDRTIEQLSQYHDQLRQELKADGINTLWAGELQTALTSQTGEGSNSFIADIKVETPDGTLKQFIFDHQDCLEIRGDSQSLREFGIFSDNQRLLSAVKVIADNRNLVYQYQTLNEIESKVRRYLICVTNQMERFDIQQGEIKSCFIYQYDGQADQTTSAEAPHLEEVNA